VQLGDGILDVLEVALPQRPSHPLAAHRCDAVTATRDLESVAKICSRYNENKPSRSTADSPAARPDRRAISWSPTG
jgi:hypothetical protein